MVVEAVSAGYGAATQPKRGRKLVKEEKVNYAAVTMTTISSTIGNCSGNGTVTFGCMYSHCHVACVLSALIESCANRHALPC
jgi:hypothetical protein